MKKRFCDHCGCELKYDRLYFDVMVSQKKSDPDDNDQTQDSQNTMTGIFCEICTFSGDCMKHLRQYFKAKKK